jgi:hypothetical protein
MDQQQPPSQPPSQQPPQPQWQQPSQPQWSPPPQQPMGWGGAPGYAAPPPRPLGVTFAAIFLIIVGVLALLIGVLALAGGALLGGALQDVQGGGLLAGFAAFFGILIILWAVLHLVGGIGSLQGKGWGRWTGIVVSVIALVFGVLGLISLLGARMDAGNLIFQIVWVALYALAAWALIQSGPYFAWRR